MGMTDEMIFRMAANALQNNQKAANSPMGLELVNILQTGEYNRGIEMANTLCQNMGMDRQTAFNQAANGINRLPIFGRN